MLQQAYNDFYTLKEFINVTEKDDKRYELIDGNIYMMSSPSVIHQDLIGFIYKKISDYLNGKNCRVFLSPLDVYLYDDNEEDCINVFQPDVFVVCDKSKIREKGIFGAPDFVVEVVSKTNSSLDYVYKLRNYMKFGVKEYWIVNPFSRQTTVYINSKNTEPVLYNFDNIIKTDLFDGLCINFSDVKE